MILMPYLLAGLTPDWTDLIGAFVDAGADAVEVGLPFSDPVADGPTMQEVNAAALARGARPAALLRELPAAPVPIYVSTYANLVQPPDFLDRVAASGARGVVVPDLPVDASATHRAASRERGLHTPLLVAPSTPDDRLRRIAAASTGFLYAVSAMRTTGERASVAAAGIALARRARAVSKVPVLVGFGVSTPDQALALSRHADGVIIGSALMRRVLDGAGVAEVAGLVADVRRALDKASTDKASTDRVRETDPA